MVFDFLPSSGQTQLIICSLPFSTPPPPTTDHPCGTSHLKLQLPLLSNPVVIIIFHTSIKDAVHILYIIPLVVVFHHLLSPSPPSLPPPPSWIFFWTWPPELRPLFIPCQRTVACRPPDPICVVCSQTGAARAKCQAPSCCLHLPQWPAQCPSLCPTLNPTARPLTADSPRPHLRVSDPAETVLKTKPTTKQKNLKIPTLSNEKTPAIVLLSTSCHHCSCVSNISPP